MRSAKRGGFIFAALGFSVVAASCGSSSSSSSNSTTTSAAKVAATSTTVAPQTFPLTGLPVTQANAANISRPALMVKIDNAPQAWPQAGINQADVVYEEMVEGGITRYMAIFQSNDAPSVGPIRSIRGTDVALAAQTGGLIAYSGGIPDFISAVQATGVVDVGANAAGGAYTRDYSRQSPHNLFSTTKTLYAAANTSVQPAHPLFQFGKSNQTIPASIAKASSSTEVYISGAADDLWTYQCSTGQYTKSIGGQPIVDTTGAPLSTTNVIIEFVNYVNTQFVDPAGNPVPEANILGVGSGEVLMGGSYAPITWSKPTNSQPTSYSYSSGQPLKLRPGRTFVVFAPTGTNVTNN